MGSHESSGSVGRTCAGCGEPLVVTNKFDRRRKWCSAKCRKGSYGDLCVDCGGRTVYGAETARVPEPRCADCSRRRTSDRRVERAVAMMTMRIDGLENDEIADRMDCPPHSVAQELSRLRSFGFNIPYGKYAKARNALPASYASDREVEILGREMAVRGYTPEKAVA